MPRPVSTGAFRFAEVSISFRDSAAVVHACTGCRSSCLPFAWRRFRRSNPYHPSRSPSRPRRNICLRSNLPKLPSWRSSCRLFPCSMRLRPFQRSRSRLPCHLSNWTSHASTRPCACMTQSLFQLPPCHSKNTSSQGKPCRELMERELLFVPRRRSRG